MRCFLVLRVVSGLILGLSMTATMPLLAASSHDVQAVRLNNNGVALMNQQQTEQAEVAFSAALKKDETLAEAALNDGIALLYMQKLPEAEVALKHALALDQRNPRIWYNMGLVQRAANEMGPAQESFGRAVELDPADADSMYFEGVCYQDEKLANEAIAMFTRALAIQPQHASSEFALARALQRSGRADEAKAHFQRFQHLTSTKVASALGLSYGDQGRYSTAVPVAEPVRPKPGMIPVHFAAQNLVGGASPASPKDGVAGSGGVCVMDVDGDGRYDLVLMESGASAIRVLRNRGDGGFERVSAEKTGLLASGHAVSCTVGDFDGDGLPDIVVALQDQLLVFRNLGGGKFENVTKAAGITAKNVPAGITFVDYDHDGDVDLLVTGTPQAVGGTPNVLWRNNGNGTFTDWTEQTGLGGKGPTLGAILSDVNNDRAVDLVITGKQGAPALYFNPREGKFPEQPLFSDKLAESVGVAALDFNKDGWMDFVVTHDGAPGISFWRNKEGKSFERVSLPIQDVVRAWGVTPIDVDNDGWVDFAAIVETSRGSEIRVFRNQGDGSFADVSKALGLDRIALKAPRALMAMDVDGDGAADLIVTSTNGEPVWLRNVGGNRNHSVRLALKGFADNKSAIGTKVEAFSDHNWQKWEVAGAAGYLSQGPPEILIGLGAAEGVDMLRMLWPTGVPQDEINVARQLAVSYTEADRRGSSCPVLFAWDGTHYVLVTDAIGAGVVGHWFTPARRNIPDPDEWVKVAGGQLVPVNGRLSLRFTEPMEEVNYIDQLRLRAIDHPEGTEVYPDERFLDEPPFASGRVVVSGAARLPAGAWDSEGRDVLKVLSTADHKFVDDFKKLPYDGFTEPHSLTLDLGEVDRANPLRLLLTGYVEYFSATSLYSAWQAGISPISPYVEAQMPDGSWRRIVKEMGFPAGLQRTIVADLTGLLPEGVRKIRIVTNLQIYWDQILVDNDAQNDKVRETEVPLGQARLRFHGYPRQIDGASPGDLNYNYDEVSLTGPFQRQRGSYTHFGDVTPLLTGVDNRYAIFGSGEELAAEFDATGLPALPPHWKRDYFFYANGYVKDMDFYDALPCTVSELPFHEMSKYPYPGSESFPEDGRSIQYQLDWNDRFDGGEPSQSFRFDYQLRPSTPTDTAAQAARAGARE